MLRSFVLLNSVDPGYRADHLLTVRMTLIFSKYAASLPRRAAIVQDMLDRPRPAASQSASSIHALPTPGTSGTGYDRADRPVPPPNRRRAATSASSRRLLPHHGHSHARGPRIRPPRLHGVAQCRDSESRGSAHALRRGEPLGKRLRVAWAGARDVEIVGVAENIRHNGLGVEPQPTLFVCNLQAPSLFTNLVVRTHGDPMTAVSRGARRRCVKWTRTRERRRSYRWSSCWPARLRGPRLQTILLGAFGALGLVLACIGVYAVISYSVAQRMREMGIRLALGAAPNAIRALVLREGMSLALTGVAAGVLAAFALTRYLSTLLLHRKGDRPLGLRRGKCAPRSGPRPAAGSPRAAPPPSTPHWSCARSSTTSTEITRNRVARHGRMG